MVKERIGNRSKLQSPEPPPVVHLRRSSLLADHAFPPYHSVCLIEKSHDPKNCLERKRNKKMGKAHNGTDYVISEHSSL